MKTKPKYWWILEIQPLIKQLVINRPCLISIFSNRKDIISRFGRYINNANQKMKEEIIFWNKRGGYKIKIYFCLDAQGRRIKFPFKKMQSFFEDKAAEVIEKIEMENLYQAALKEGGIK